MRQLHARPRDRYRHQRSTASVSGQGSTVSTLERPVRSQQQRLPFLWKGKLLLLLLLTIRSTIRVFIAQADGIEDDLERRAVLAMTARGIDNAAELLEFATPEDAIAACEWWDGESRRKPVKVGLLAWKIRQGGVPQDGQQPKRSRAELLRGRFEELTADAAVGDPFTAHARLACWNHEDPNYGAAMPREACEGSMVVVERVYPLLTVECDQCGFVAALPLRALAGLRKPKDFSDRIYLAESEGRQARREERWRRSPRSIDPARALGITAEAGAPVDEDVEF